MLFDDDISCSIDDLRDVGKSKICMDVPLKTNISLKDLWIPTGLLINRQKAIDSNRNRPYIYHTLCKPDAESFSVYIDDSKDSTGNENLLTFELSDSYEKNLNVPSTDDTDSPKLCFQNKDENSEQYFPKLCFSDEEENFEQDSTELCSKRDENSEQELQLFLELLNKESPENKTKCHSMDKSENLTNTICTKKQDKFENQVLDTLNSESPITVEDETKKIENFLMAINVEKENLDEKVKKHCLDTLSSEIPLHEAKMECHSKEHSDNLVDMERLCADSLPGCITEAAAELSFAELPVAYQKHSVQDPPPPKQKNLKEKKKKNAANKSIQLGDFLQTPNSDGYVAPERDEFYDNLVRRGICAPRELPYSTGYPEADYYSYSTQDSFAGDFPKEDGPILSNNDCAMSSFESIENVESCAVEELEDKTLTTLVLENISRDISPDNVENFMSTYGELKDISFEINGTSLKVIAKLVLQHDDIEWIIDCLNGSDPFGASGELLKCYRLEE